MTQPSQADHRRLATLAQTLATLAQTLAERRSASSASVTAKVASNGTWHGEASTTADTTEEDIDRMTRLAIRSVAEIAARANGA